MRQTELCVPQNHIKTTLTHHSGSSTKANEINEQIKALSTGLHLHIHIQIISHVQMRLEKMEETNVY